MTQTVLILGPNGRFGGAAARAFRRAGWSVRLFDRSTDRLPQAATGVDVIVNGWNPPYERWAAELPGLTDLLVETMRDSGATLIQACNVYVYGDGSGERLGPDTPHAAENPLGMLRREMEARLRAAGTPVILLRAGDFIDTEASGNWIDRVMLKEIGKGRLTYPGDPDIPHAWAYLPDLADAAVGLAERRSWLPRVSEVLFPGYTLTGHEIARLAAKATGQDIRLQRMSWLPLRLVAPVWPMVRGLLEMRYLWTMPHRLDGSGLSEILPDFRQTPPEDAIARQIAALVARDAPVPGGAEIRAGTSP